MDDMGHLSKSIKKDNERDALPGVILLYSENDLKVILLR